MVAGSGTSSIVQWTTLGSLARIIRETPAGGVLVDEVGAKVFLAVL
jgi:hypothetical protein